MNKVTPYVYLGTHKTDGRFYIGSRYTVKLKLSPSDDLVLYRTSSKIVKPIFDEFDWVILAQFLTPEAAFDFEQELIEQHWGDTLMLNRACYNGDNGRFMNGLQGKVLTEEHKQKLSNAKKGKPGTKWTDAHKLQHSADRKGKASNRPGFKHTEEHKLKMSIMQKGKVLKDEDILKWCKRFIITDPNGNVYDILNLNKFCRENGLTNSNMTYVAKGKYSNHKGWLCRYAT
jgi:hypothetical protein